MSDTKPKFTVCLIAKNEAKTLPKLVESLKEYKDRGGEILLLDTGSTDGTPTVARNIGCLVSEVGDKFLHTIDQETTDAVNNRFIVDGDEPVLKVEQKYFDFASARNYIASLATTPMVAMPDCDEAYTKLDIDKLNEVIEQGNDQLEYNFVFSHDQFGNEAIKFMHCKFFNKEKMEWRGIIHEIICPKLGISGIKRCYLGEEVIKLEHWQNQATNRASYLSGLAIDCFQHQDNDRNSHYFARELFWSGRRRSAIKEFQRHLVISNWNAEKSQSMLYIGDCYMALNDKDSAFDWWNRAYALEPTRREPLMKFADYYFKRNDWARTSVYCSAMLQIPWSGFYSNHYEFYAHLPHEMMYISQWWLGNKEESKKHFLKAYNYCPANPKYIDEMQFYYPVPKVSIVIPTLRKGWKLQRLLESITKNAGYVNYEVIVEEDNWENRQGAPITFKKGVEKTTGDLVMFLGDDCIMQPGCVGKAVMSMFDHFGPDMDGLIGLNDSYWQLGEVATHWMASKKLLPYLGGEFFHTGYHHCGCDNELTERCRKIDRYFWDKDCVIFHDHPVQRTGTDQSKDDEVYRVAYNPDSLAHDKALLAERAAKYGFELRANFTRPRDYPAVHPDLDLRKAVTFIHKDLDIETKTCLNVGIGEGTSSLAMQLPFLRFKKLGLLDVWQPYLDKANTITWDAREKEGILCDVKDYQDFDKWDMFFMFDVLEHLTKEDSLSVMDRIGALKNKDIVIFIPLENEFRKNVFEVGPQEHLSLWTEQDFIDRGYYTKRLVNFHFEDGRYWDALWAFKKTS